MLHFSGVAQLEVSSGAVAVAGCIISASRGSVDICADVRLGGPLVIEAVNSSVAVPLVGGVPASFTLRNCLPKPWNAFEIDQGTKTDLPAADPTASDAATRISVSESTLYTLARKAPAQRALSSFKVQQPPLMAAIAAHPPLDTPQIWCQAVSDITASASSMSAVSKSPVIAVVGSKRTGKSSFARLLANSLLNHYPAVAFLDTDCGQPEFGAPGLVSLTTLRSPITGPPHMHPVPPDRAHFIGDISPQVNPGLFVSAITSLITWYQEEDQQPTNEDKAEPSRCKRKQTPTLPLVLNTHGWIKGAGLDILEKVLGTLQPTHLVQMQSNTSSRNLPDDTSWLSSSAPSLQTHLVLPAVDCSLDGNINKTLSPVDSRALTWLAFGRCCLDETRHGGSQPLSWNAAAFTSVAVALSQQPPFATDLQGLSIQVMHCAVPLHEVPAAINGTVVGLSVSGKSKGAAATMSHVLTATALDAPPLECLGLGIVRGIDSATGSVFILSPLTAAQIQKVDTLQIGRLHLPPALLQAPGLLAPHLALFSLAADCSGARSMKSRGNLQRAVHG